MTRYRHLRRAFPVLRGGLPGCAEYSEMIPKSPGTLHSPPATIRPRSNLTTELSFPAQIKPFFGEAVRLLLAFPQITSEPLDRETGRTQSIHKVSSVAAPVTGKAFIRQSKLPRLGRVAFADGNNQITGSGSQNASQLLQGLSVIFDL